MVIQKKAEHVAAAIMEIVQEKEITTVCLGKIHLNLFQVILKPVFQPAIENALKNDVDLVILS